MEKHLKKLTGIPWTDVKITGEFWQRRQAINRKVTLPAEYAQCRQTGRLDAMKGLYKPDKTGRDILLDRANGAEIGIYHPGGKITYTSLAELENLSVEDLKERAPRPHHYWDSDVAKWIEAMSYSFSHEPNPAMEQVIDQIVDDYESMQMDDGYLNTYFSYVEPGQRWTNVSTMHELYCAGHLTEAAVAYYQATGKRKFLDIICRYIDHIDTRFGPERDKLHGYPGHQELELALVKLYRVTGNETYLRLSKYFIDERGRQPLYFDIEEERNSRGPNPSRRYGKNRIIRDFLAAGPHAQKQSHLPVREQKTAEGHAVRLMYQLCGMTDVAVETGDEGLLAACKTLWEDVTRRKMYVTGGVGAEQQGERFAFSYHLPNERAYSETCAAIGLVMWASRMLQPEANREYADVMERALYNSVISGVSITGDKFFYANHLASHPKVYENQVERQTRMFPVRQSWFPVSCCPPNLARLTESVGGYAFSKSEDTVYCHLYMDSSITLELRGGKVDLEMRTAYPTEETVRLTVNPARASEFSLALRIPAWCRNPWLRIDDSAHSISGLEKGYLHLNRLWSPGDKVELVLPMEPFLLEAHPAVRMNCGKVAIQCGPLVYCLEEEDNGSNLADILLDADSALAVRYEPDLLGGVRIVTAKAKRRRLDRWDGALYRPAGSEYEDCEIKAIPYYLWSNRSPGEMLVWIRYRQ